MTRDDSQVRLFTAPVLGEFMVTALIWFIPAVLLLPFVLLVIGFSAVAGDGSLLELGEGIRGKVLTALGPLLIACGIAAIVVAVLWDADVEGWITFGVFAAVSIAAGWYATHRALRRIARRL